MSLPDFPPLRLRKNEHRRLRQGHLWVFSNEVDNKATPLREFSAGDAVKVLDSRGQVLGTGYVNPNSLICARLVSKDRNYPFTDSLFVHRLKVALSLRQRLYPEPFYRLVYGESDGLPGLVIDRFGDVFVVQINTAGMELKKEAIVAALNKLFKPQAIQWRNDSPIRELEGLPLYVETAQGELPDSVEILEHGARFLVPMLKGQKTGWFYDQHDNRGGLSRYVKGARVLDLFSYVGGWGIQAVRAGAESALCVDESASAIDYVNKNAALNGLSAQVSAFKGEAFKTMSAMQEVGEKFDVIVVDPPAFVKRKKAMKKGQEAYGRINQQAMKLLNRDGFLISCSCSYHMPRASLIQQLNRGATFLGRNLQIVAQGGQSADHPVHPAIPETEYLKAIYSRVTR